MEKAEMIARKIKAYFKDHDLTLADAAEKIGVSQQAVSNQLSRPFSRKAAQKWHEIFGFDEMFLMTGEGSLDMEPDPEPEKEGIYIPAETQEMYTAMAQSIRQLSEIVNRLTAQKAVRLKGGGIPFLDGLEDGV